MPQFVQYSQTLNRDYPNHRAKNGKSITGEFEFYNTYAARSLVW